MFKYALFVVVALCAVQGFQARAVQVDDDDVSDAIDKIMHIVYQFKDVVTNTVHKLPEIIQDFRDKGLAIVQDTDVFGRIDKLQQKVADIIATGEEGKKCADAQADEITAFAENAETTAFNCVDGAESEITKIEGIMQSVTELGNYLINRVADRIRSCVSDGSNILNCLERLVDPISEELAIFQQKVENAVSNAEEIVERVINNLRPCYEKLKTDMIAQEKKIMTDIKQCMFESD